MEKKPELLSSGENWSQGLGEHSLLPLGLPITPPPSVPAASTSVPAPSSPQPRVGLQGRSIPCLPQSFLQTLQRVFSPPLLIISSPTTTSPPPRPRSPASLYSSCQATCVTTRARGKKWGGVKKPSKTPWHASPESIFGEHCFFLSKQESRREK